MTTGKFFLSILCIISGMLPIQMQAKTVDTHRVEAYIRAVKQAKRKVERFKQAVKSGDTTRIKQATLEIQEDPAAIKALNKENTFVKKHFVDTTERIQAETIEGIKKRVAKEYGVKPEDVRVKNFTNPSSEVKAGHDWDVTVTVKKKVPQKGGVHYEDIPYKKVEDIVHKSYFDAAGGKKSYPKSSAKSFAENHHVEVTSKHHAEAYEGGSDYIKNTTKYKIKDPEKLAKTIKYKSTIEKEKARKYEGDGALEKAEVSKHEQARQYTKQYEKHIEPRIKERGGRVPENVRKGTEILRKIGKPSKKLGRIYTPADADADLAKLGKHGETVESIIKKGSALVESGQKFGPKTKEYRLKKKLGHANEELESAFQHGDKKGIKKAKSKIARTKYELKQEQLKTKQATTGKTKNSSLDEPLSGKTVKASGSVASEEGLTTKAKKLAGKVLEKVGAGAVIFNTAEDIKESLQGKKSWKETGKNMADMATGGAISTTEATIKKNKDFTGAVKTSEKAQAQENEASVLKMGHTLRKSGVSKEETVPIMDDMRKGENHPLYKKLHTLRKKGIKIPLSVPNQVEEVKSDDTAAERVKELGEGIIEYGKRAGKFMLKAGKDILKSGKYTAQTIKSKVDAYLGGREGKGQLEEIKKALIAKGISPQGAEIAIERYKDGHKETLRNIVKKLHQKDQEKKAKERTEAKQRAEKIRAMAKAKIRRDKAKKTARKKAEKIRKLAKEREAQQRIAAKKRREARERLRKKIEESKQRKLERKRYVDMSVKEKHDALKGNDDAAWAGLEKRLKKDLTETTVQKTLWTGTYRARASAHTSENSQIKITGKFTVVLAIHQHGDRIKGTYSILGFGPKPIRASVTGKVNGLSAQMTIVSDESTHARAHITSDGSTITVIDSDGESGIFTRIH